jgi:hypothetical protein
VSREVDPEAILIDYVLERDEETMGFRRQPLENPLWHLADEIRALTFCDLDIGYGYTRRVWSEVKVAPEKRCPVCESQQGHGHNH